MPGNEQDIDYLNKIALLAVRSAEQLEMNKQLQKSHKQNYAIDLVTNTVGAKYSQAIIEGAIESAVFSEFNYNREKIVRGEELPEGDGNPDDNDVSSG